MRELLALLRDSREADGAGELVRRCHAAAQMMEQALADRRGLADRIKALDPDRLGTANQTMSYLHGFSAGIAEAESLVRRSGGS